MFEEGKYKNYSGVPGHPEVTVGKSSSRLVIAWLLPQWRNVLFSDETRFGLASDDYRETVWRERGGQNRLATPISVAPYRGGTQMFWGAIKTTMYADDTTFSFNLNSDDLSEILQADTIIDHSKQWFNSNELFLNIEKTEICSFSLKTCQNNSHVRFLGIDLDSSLSWSLHIENLCTVYAIKKVSQTVDTEAAVTAYYGLFHSSLSYGILSWGNASFSQLQKVFIIQKAAVRGIVNARPVEHCKDLFKHFKITTLFGLIVFQNLIYIRIISISMCMFSINEARNSLESIFYLILKTDIQQAFEKDIFDNLTLNLNHRIMGIFMDTDVTMKMR
nr:unnamed protein product [Callosobruchus chinensis]